MRRAAIYAPGDVRVENVPEPKPEAMDVMVRITGVGLCGSDLHWYEEGAIGDAVLEHPLVLGHEMAGIAVSGPLAGRPVAIDPAVPCGRCRECAGNLEHLCARMRFAGHGNTDGALRELMPWPASQLHVLPDGFDAAQGALLEPLGVAVHATDLGHLRHGWNVAVVGCGPIGLMIIQLATMARCHVVAVEPLAHRRDAARRAGAQRAVAPHEHSDTPSGENDCQVGFEVSGTDDGLDRTARLVRPGGRVVIVGIPNGDTTTFSAALMRRKGLTLALARRMTADAYVRAIDLGTSGAVDLDWLTSHRFPLVDVAEAFEAATRRVGLKVVVDVTSG